MKKKSIYEFKQSDPLIIVFFKEVVIGFAYYRGKEKQQRVGRVEYIPFQILSLHVLCL